jgi:hypothetical protein
MMYIIRKRNKLLLFNVERDMLEGYKEMRERKWVVIYDAGTHIGDGGGGGGVIALSNSIVAC